MLLRSKRLVIVPVVVLIEGGRRGVEEVMGALKVEFFLMNSFYLLSYIQKKKSVQEAIYKNPLSSKLLHSI